MRRRILLLAIPGFALCVAFFLWPRGRCNRPIGDILHDLVTLEGFESVVWDGYADRVITIEVVDDKDGRPLSGAKVRLSKVYAKEDVSEGNTSGDGRVALNCRFAASGQSSLFISTAGISLVGNELKVDAEGYEPQEDFLAMFAKTSRISADSPLPVVHVRLLRKQ